MRSLDRSITLLLCFRLFVVENLLRRGNLVFVYAVRGRDLSVHSHYGIRMIRG
ncbi:hypothetical protein SB861_50490 [Paraburkholderia sp. SIMBA_049]